MQARIIFLLILIICLPAAVVTFCPPAAGFSSPAPALSTPFTQEIPPASQNSSLQTSPAPLVMLTGTLLRVNDDAVTSTEVIAPFREQLGRWALEMTWPQFNDNLGEPKRTITDSAVNRVHTLLLYQHAQRRLGESGNFEPAINAEIALKTDEIMAKYDGSLTRAQAELARQGTTLDDELEQYRRFLVATYYQQTYVTSAVRITRRQMLRYYRNHLQDYTQSPKVQFQLIDIQAQKFLHPDLAASLSEPLMREARALAAAAAQKALKKIQAGVDFAQVVQEFSHGYRKSFDGFWRPLDPTSLQEQYQPIIVALDKIELGQHTGIIEGQNRFFIAKLIDREEAVVTPFLEAQAEIKAKLFQENQYQQLNKLLRDRLEKATLGDLNLFIDNITRAVYQQMNNEGVGK